MSTTATSSKNTRRKQITSMINQDPNITEETQRAELAALEDIAGSLRLIARALCALADVPHFQRDDEIQHKAPGGRK